MKIAFTASLANTSAAIPFSMLESVALNFYPSFAA